MRHSAESSSSPEKPQLSRRAVLAAGLSLMVAASAPRGVSREVFEQLEDPAFRRFCDQVAADSGLELTLGKWPGDYVLTGSSGQTMRMGLVQDRSRQVASVLVEPDHYYFVHDGHGAPWQQVYKLSDASEYEEQVRSLGQITGQIEAIYEQHGIRVGLFRSSFQTFKRVEGLWDLKNILELLTIIDHKLSTLPPVFLEATKKPSIFLCKSIANKKNCNFTGAIGREAFLELIEKYWYVLLTSDGVERSLFHELFHVVDKDTEDQVGDAWNQLSEPYDPIEGCYIDEDQTRLAGFISRYGAHNEQEDRATIGNDLLEADCILALLETASTDSVLAQKIRFLTGCEWDFATQKCLRLIPLESYKKAFQVDDYQFFARWSRDDHGQITIDPDYYNRVIARALDL